MIRPLWAYSSSADAIRGPRGETEVAPHPSAQFLGLHPPLPEFPLLRRPRVDDRADNLVSTWLTHGYHVVITLLSRCYHVAIT